MTIRLSDHFTYRKLLRFVLPSVVMVVFTSIYGVVDGLFVSNFAGKTAFAAINLIMPFLMMLGGVGFMVGAGGSALVGKTLGEQKTQTAHRYFSMMILFGLALGLSVTVLGLIFLKPICHLLGVTDSMMPDCLLYGRINLAFSCTFILQNLFQSFLITAGKPKLGLYATMAAGVTNMVLDALFVGVFRWGVAGAAIATGLSQCVGGVLPLIYFLRPNTSLLRLVRTPIEWRAIGQACWNGSSEFMSNISSSIVGMLYNIQLMKYGGENGVAAYGVLMYVQFIFFAIFIGYAIGSAPIVSYHYGAQNLAELRNMRKKSMLILTSAGLIMFVLAQASASWMAKIFVGYDADLCQMTIGAFRLSSFAFLLAGFNIFGSSFFTALNNGGVSAALSFLRTLVFQLTSILLLPRLLALNGIWWSVVVAEFFASITTLIFLLKLRKKYQY